MADELPDGAEHFEGQIYEFKSNEKFIKEIEKQLNSYRSDALFHMKNVDDLMEISNKLTFVREEADKLHQFTDGNILSINLQVLITHVGSLVIQKWLSETASSWKQAKDEDGETVDTQ